MNFDIAQNADKYDCCVHNCDDTLLDCTIFS